MGNLNDKKLGYGKILKKMDTGEYNFLQKDLHNIAEGFVFELEDVEEAIRKTLLDNQKHVDKQDEGYEEFERGYRIAMNHCRLNIEKNFGDVLLGEKE